MMVKMMRYFGIWAAQGADPVCFSRDIQRVCVGISRVWRTEPGDEIPDAEMQVDVQMLELILSLQTHVSSRKPTRLQQETRHAA